MKKYAFLFLMTFAVTATATESIAQRPKLSRQCYDSLIDLTKNELNKNIQDEDDQYTKCPAVLVYDGNHYKVSLQGDFDAESCLVTARLSQQKADGTYDCQPIKASHCGGGGQISNKCQD